MIQNHRHAFNSSFTQDQYKKFLHLLDEKFGMHIDFRINETPIFITKVFEQKLVSSATEILHQLMAPEYLRQSSQAFPPNTEAPNESDHPEFVQIDFGVIRNADGSHDLRLIELQGFPSVYVFQEYLGRFTIEYYGLVNVHHLLKGMTTEEYYDLMKRTIVGDHKNENVILMEVDPLHQKTRPDFIGTEQILGIKTIDITTIEREGKDLFYRNDEEKRIHIDRIYNRAIIDELETKRTRYAFKFTDELNVTWACHPNWYYRISKYSLPFITHPIIPKTTFLDELKSIPDDLDNFVLKPLYSFAGSGVIVSPTREQIEAVPREHWHHYVLQEKVEYAPILETPSGGTKVEFRVMFLWDTEPRPVNLVVRTGRGKMMGVDYNKNLDWVGATCALIED